MSMRVYLTFPHIFFEVIGAFTAIVFIVYQHIFLRFLVGQSSTRVTSIIYTILMDRETAGYNFVKLAGFATLLVLVVTVYFEE